MLVKASLYLDKRYLNKDGKSALRIALRHKGQCSYLHTNIFLYPDTWDGNSVIGGRDAKILNGVIYQKLTSVESAIIKLQSDGAFFRKNIDEIAHLIMIEVDPEYAEKVHEQQMINYAASNGIYARFLQYIDQRNAEGTKSIYRWTLQMIELFCKKNRANANTLLFDDITIAWLESFQKFCRLTEKQNSVAIHLRNIRTVLNAAIDDGITSNYPFRKFKIKTEETVYKSYTARELRTFFQAKCYTDGVQEAQDMFKLMFCLIGINIKDLMYLDGLYKGRVVYSRMKTSKPYSVKVVPEAMEIIRKYQGKNLMLNCLERIPNFKTYSRRLRANLCRVGIVSTPGKKCTGIAILPDICTGAARTSWATIAQEELDIPRDVIAAALGHHTVDVTSTYLRTDWKKKVDEANRKVLDWVFYEKF